jgi:hypothetical protein
MEVGWLTRGSTNLIVQSFSPCELPAPRLGWYCWVLDRLGLGVLDIWGWALNRLIFHLHDGIITSAESKSQGN